MTALRLALLGGMLLTSDLPARQLPEEKPWSVRFPEVSRRVRHLDRRMGSADVQIRKRVLTELTFGRPRDSKVYPPFFRALLTDPSPEIRGLAVERLWEHQVFLKREELPRSFTVHFLDEFRWQDPTEVARARTVARSLDAEGGWAIQALAIIGDPEAIPLARLQLESTNIFVRFQAAMALVQRGQTKEGIDTLHKVIDARDDASGFYRYRAAECLFRLGHRDAIHELFSQMEQKNREGYLDGPREILEDLTGQYFLTAAEGREWWKKLGPQKP